MYASEDHDEEQGANAPDLSIIIAIGEQRERAERALRSVLDQRLIDRIEVLLFDLAPENCPALPGSNHPRVRTIRRTPQDLLGDARAEGVRAARSSLVCFMEEHCEMKPNFVEAIVSAHRGTWAAVGSDFINGNPNAGLSNKAFDMNYGIYVRPACLRGPVPRVSGQNSTFKRDVLLRYASELNAMMNCDLVLQLKMQQDGYQFFFEPAARFAHHNENSLRSLAFGVFYWNWCYSNTRAESFKWSRLRRMIWIILTPLIPWVRLFRMFTWMWNRGRMSVLKFVRDVPFTLTINYCSAAGQLAGLVAPSERATREFSHFEMNEPRLLQAELGR